MLARTRTTPRGGPRTTPAAGSSRLVRAAAAAATPNDSSGGNVRRSKQYTARKELQKQSQQEYIRRIYEGAERVEDDQLVYTLQPSSPRVRAELQDSEQHAALNRQLGQQIPQLADWTQLRAFLQQHSASLNFLNVVALASRAAALLQQQQQQEQQDTPRPPAALDPQLARQLAVLVLQHSSWFQPPHFAASAVALSTLDVRDADVWVNLTAAAEHKVGAFTFRQVASTLEALALAGFTPELSWIERCYRQAGKHLAAAEPGDIAVLMWAWGTMGYTPRDRLFMNQVKILTRRGFGQLSSLSLVQLLHGLARMPRYAPNQGWLAALAKAARPQLSALPAGAVVDLLLSLVSLRFDPAAGWMDAACKRLQGDMTAALASSSSTADGGDTQQQQQQLLFLPPVSLQPGQLMPEGPGVLVATHALREQQQGSELQAAPQELQQLQDLFDEAAAAGEEVPHGPDQQCQQQASGAAATAADAPLAAAAAAAAAAARPAAFEAQLTGEHLGVLCWCLGRVEFTPRSAWMQLLGRLLLQHCAASPAEVLVDACLGCVAAGYLPTGPLQVQLLAALQARVADMSQECLRRLCQALTSYEAALSEQQQQQQAAASGLQQYVQHQRPQLAAAVLQRQEALLRGSSTAQLADTLAFLAAAGATPELAFMEAAVTRAVEQLPAGCPAPSVCTLLWALAVMGFKPHPQLLHALLAALQRGLHLLGSQDLADAAWALSTLKHRPGTQWLALYLKEAAAKAQYMQPQALTDTLWALACFAAQPDRECLKQLVLAVGGRAGRLGRQNAAVAVWALQQLGLTQAQLLAGSGSAGGVGSAVQQLLQAVAGV